MSDETTKDSPRQDEQLKIFDMAYVRTIPPRKPEGHQPAAPRHSLRWTKPVLVIVSDYFGIQGQNLSWDDQRAFFNRVESDFTEPDGPDSSEIMRCEDELGFINAVIVGYWTDPVKHARFCARSAVLKWLQDGNRLSESVGYWRETLRVPYDRHETIYSENWYRIGISRTAASTIVPITTNGFFGAARDRIPLSAIDPLDSPWGDQVPERKIQKTQRRRIRLEIPVNMVTLRSGQYWAHAETEQLADYMENMRPRLMTGMDHLLRHKQESGTLSLRILTNLDDDGTERKETSVLAHFVSLAHLETWAANHQTHLDIYRHAVAMNRKYKEERQFVSWHELFVNLFASFEYINCHPETGLLPYFGALG